MRPARRFAILSLLWLAPAGLPAQTVAGGARAAGLSDAHGALARGPAAALVNPANLGLPGNPTAALQLPAMSLAGSAHPIGLGEIAAYSNAVLPRPVRESWLARIPAGGAFHAAAARDLEVGGLSLGPIAVTASQIAEASATVPRDAVKLLFFGNGADGVRHPIDFRRARVDASRGSVVSAAAGLPLRRWDGGRHALAAGLTAKRVLGHGLLALRDAGADLAAEPGSLDLRFPTVIASDTTRWVQSAGWGVDAGLAYAGPRVGLGLTVTDLANTFRWDRGPVTVRDGRAWVTTDDAGLAFTPLALDDPALDDSVAQVARDLVGAARFRPSARLALAWRPAARLSLTSDLVHRTAQAGAMQAGLRTTWSIGAETTVLRWLPLRAGSSLGAGELGWSAGAGLRLGPVALDGAVGRRAAPTSGEPFGAASLTIGWR